MKYAVGILLAVTLLLGARSLGGYHHCQLARYQCGPVATFEKDSTDSLREGVYFHFQTELAEEVIGKSNAEWIDEEGIQYFTSYLINTSDTLFKASRQDGSLMMIQEALDEKDVWHPIEYWEPSSCGNSYFSPLLLQPDEYVTVPIRRYEGDFATKVRLRMYRDSNVFVSQPFQATIDKGLFNKVDEGLNSALYYGRAWYFEN